MVGLCSRRQRHDGYFRLLTFDCSYAAVPRMLRMLFHTGAHERSSNKRPPVPALTNLPLCRLVHNIPQLGEQCVEFGLILLFISSSDDDVLD